MSGQRAGISKTIAAGQERCTTDDWRGGQYPTYKYAGTMLYQRW